MKRLILFLFVGLSQQICHNGVCDTDKCQADEDCPAGYTCDLACGNCNPIDGYCTGHAMCSNFNGICDVPTNPYTTCEYCDFDTNLCSPGCVDGANCPDGYQCIGNQCVEKLACSDDAYCNQGLSDPPICDVGNKPYTTCFYCDGGECLPGCVTTDNCPASYTCSNNVCQASPGSVLINSITVKTKSCSGCDGSAEGLTVTLKGQISVGYENGLPCTANLLDHEGVTDYVPGQEAVFGGEDDQETMGGCYEAPLNGELLGGTLTWNQAGTWEPEQQRAVCVDWSTETKYAWSCDATKYGDHFNLVNCHNLVPKVRCDQE